MLQLLHARASLLFKFTNYHTLPQITSSITSPIITSIIIIIYYHIPLPHPITIIYYPHPIIHYHIHHYHYTLPHPITIIHRPHPIMHYHIHHYHIHHYPLSITHYPVQIVDWHASLLGSFHCLLLLIVADKFWVCCFFFHLFTLKSQR